MKLSGFGTSTLNSLSQYNFRDMTNDQFLKTVRKLSDDGKLSKTSADQLSMVAQGVDSVPITGASPSVTQILSDPTRHDFISEIEGDDRSAHRPGAVGGGLYDQLLKALQSVNETSENVASLP